MHLFFRLYLALLMSCLILTLPVKTVAGPSITSITSPIEKWQIAKRSPYGRSIISKVQGGIASDKNAGIERIRLYRYKMYSFPLELKGFKRGGAKLEAVIKMQSLPDPSIHPPIAPAPEPEKVVNPEPETYLILGTLLLFILFKKRKKRRSQQTAKLAFMDKQPPTFFLGRFWK